MKLNLDVLIVNWNSADQLRQCLESLTKTDSKDCEVASVVVVDNGSSDDSINDLKNLPLPLNLIRNSENRGFAAACNQAAGHGKGEFMLFLNPDTKLTPSALDKVIKFLREPGKQQVGICGAQMVDSTGQVVPSCCRFPSLPNLFWRIIGLDRIAPLFFRSALMSEWSHLETRQVDQVIGAFFLVRRKVFESLQGFDERFFVYYEEVDFSIRAKKLNWESWYVASAQVFHKGGGSSEQVKAARLFYSLRSRLLYVFKHFGFISATLILLATLLIEPITRIIFALSKRSIAAISETLSAYWRLWVALPGILRT